MSLKKQKDIHTQELAQLMLDAVPVGALCWDESYRCISCNEETVRLLGVSGKYECVEDFWNFLPRYQPDGAPSDEELHCRLAAAFQKGYGRFVWTLQTVHGHPLPAEITLVRVRHGEGHVLVGAIYDLRPIAQLRTYTAQPMLAQNA